MKEISILVIAPYAEMVPSIKAVAKDFPAIKATIFVGSYEEAIQSYPCLINRSIACGFEIVVARGFTAEQLLQKSLFPVIEIETSLYDTLRTIKSAQQRDCRFAVMGSKAIIAAARQLIAVLRISDVPLIDIDSREMAAEQAKLLKEQDVMLIVGDLFAIEACRRIGIDSMLICSGKASVEQTFRNVIRLSNNISASEQHCTIYRQTLEHCGHAVLIFDQCCKEIFSNEDSEFQLPFELKKWIQERLFKMDEEGTTTRKKVFGDILYKVVITSIKGGNPFYIVHIRPYEKFSPSATDDFLQVINPFDGFDDKFVLTEMQQLFPIHPIPKQIKNASVMLYGESGTGKEFLAREYWKNGIYSNSPMLLIECTNLSKRSWELLSENAESIIYELGYTILLKNIHRLSLDMQLVINNFLDSTCYRRTHSIICTSDVHLGNMVNCGTFLPELYSKIAEYEQYLPTLNEKPESIKKITDLCIAQFNVQYNREIIDLDTDAAEALTNYRWKNNIGQLEDVMRYLVLNAQTPYISADEVQIALDRFSDISCTYHLEGTPVYLNGTLAEMEIQIIRSVIEKMNGHYAEAAKRLGISRTTLWRMLKQ